MNNANQSAFPQHPMNSSFDGHGITKREYFAALAMQALLSNPHQTTKLDWVARNAVGYADALLAELEKEATP